MIRIRTLIFWIGGAVLEDSYEAIRHLMIAINKIDGGYYLCARKLGINENMLALLYALDDGEAHSQKQICEDWLIPKTTINTVVHELTEAGYITLIPGKKRREKIICLTEEGKRYTHSLVEKLYVAEQEALRETLENFSPEFVEAMDCFAGNLEAAFHRHILG